MYVAFFGVFFFTKKYIHSIGCTAGSLLSTSCLWCYCGEAMIDCALQCWCGAYGDSAVSGHSSGAGSQGGGSGHPAHSHQTQGAEDEDGPDTRMSALLPIPLFYYSCLLYLAIPLLNPGKL